MFREICILGSLEREEWYLFDSNLLNLNSEMYETNFGVSSCFIYHIRCSRTTKKVGLVLSGGGAKVWRISSVEGVGGSRDSD